MSYYRYEVGDSAVLRWSASVDGVLTDPTTLSLVVTPPAGGPAPYVWTVTGGEIEKDDVGIYHATIDLSAAGYWRFKFTSTGPAKGTKKHTVVVRPEDEY